MCHTDDAKRHRFESRKAAKAYVKARGIGKYIKPYWCPRCAAWRLTHRCRRA